MTAVKLCGVVTVAVVSGFVGSAFTRNFGSSSYTLSYADFISIMLTAVSLLITVLAVFLAVAGVIGWNSIERRVHSKAEDFLNIGFNEGGPLHEMLFDRVTEALRLKTEEIMFEGIAPIPGIDDDEGDSAA